MVYYFSVNSTLFILCKNKLTELKTYEHFLLKFHASLTCRDPSDEDKSYLPFSQFRHLLLFDTLLAGTLWTHQKSMIFRWMKRIATKMRSGLNLLKSQLRIPLKLFLNKTQVNSFNLISMWLIEICWNLYRVYIKLSETVMLSNIKCSSVLIQWWFHSLKWICIMFIV